MTKFLVILTWPSANIKSSDTNGSISATPFDEKIGNVLVQQAPNEGVAKKKALKLLGKNQDVEKYLRVYNLDLIDSWMYFKRG